MNKKAKWLLAMLELVMRDSKAAMAVFAAYIDEDLCYEYFSDGLPKETFEAIRDALKTDEEFRKAVSLSGIVDRGVKRYVRAALDDYDMWFHFQDGIDKILSDQELCSKLTVHERNVVRGLFALWREGKLNDLTWDSCLMTLRKTA